ncbi:indole-3-glycerol phosphate synthase TrpC [Bacillus sp. SM2101]|uniref:indole-3-glycerol phosphate synthase TrpC n=1 Tax=Bacillus sp. SM2101 TaxID=2805366 RepID=UPI001BDE5DB2|nr:indole-3-glycerol phosphate synthase TrpC [Bacillus sp. SM2101]
MLEKILEVKREEINKLELRDEVQVEKFSFYEALKNTTLPLGLIAEVKKASPSKGIIRGDFHPTTIAKAYEQAGASAISVLTDEPFFQGHHSYLSEIKKIVNIPALRKDFIIDSIQVEESRRLGADAILLIGEALSPVHLHELYVQAQEADLDVLVEVHSKETLDNILSVFTPKIIGINNRNLKTFETSLHQTIDLVRDVPKDSLLVSESGIFTNEDIKMLKHCGANAVLVGEALMRQDDLVHAIHQLMGSEYVENN